MLLEELVLENFGVYKGRHSIDLTPRSPGKPIVLFGALNGGGKTTILDALKLVLYGKLAQCSNRSNLSYPEFLQRSINKDTDSKKGAKLELQFRNRRNGIEDTIRVIRIWHSTGKGIKETTEVLFNSNPEPLIADRWYEYIEEFIPAQVSSLFFFDGEKIENLAAEEQSADLIRTGLHALLGLDLVDRLSKDLRYIENKRKIALTNFKDRSTLDEHEQEIRALEERYQALMENLASKRSEHQNLKNKFKRLRKKFNSEGGELLEQQDIIKAEVQATKDRLTDSEINLRELASGAAPLLLVRDQLKAAEIQAKKEKEIQLNKAIKNSLALRDKKIIQSLKDENVDTATIQQLKELLSKDISSRDKNSKGEVYLHIDPSVFQSVNDDSLDLLSKSIKTKVQKTKEIRAQLSEHQLKLASIPEPDSLSDLSDSIKSTEKMQSEMKAEIYLLEQDLSTLTKKVDQKKEEHLRQVEKLLGSVFIDETNIRVFNHSQKLRSTLTAFRQQVALKHIKQLERLILESFNQLIRKPDLVNRIAISSYSYSLTLFNRKNQQVLPERLSAGERQLLSISILWGLAKASDRPLPAVIDTPLGRLDSKHRECLVTNYLPFASHQVLVLSTDEEINGQYYSKIKRFVGREYKIEYIPDEASSYLTNGYPWK